MACPVAYRAMFRPNIVQKSNATRIAPCSVAFDRLVAESDATASRYTKINEMICLSQNSTLPS
jgi:hypothetical protein